MYQDVDLCFILLFSIQVIVNKLYCALCLGCFQTFLSSSNFAPLQQHGVVFKEGGWEGPKLLLSLKDGVLSYFLKA